MSWDRNRLQQLRQIPLAEVLRATGAQPDRQDRKKWHTAHGPISIRGMKFINWKQNCGGGGAIDLVMHLKELDYVSAVAWLAGWHLPVGHAPQPFHSSSAVRPLRLPLPDPSRLPAVKGYLYQQRAIPLAVIQSLLESHRLYADNRGNAVFLLCDAKNRPVGAELRGTGSVRWRGLAPGSRKDLGYFGWHQPAGATRIVLCESAIDAISCFLLHPGCFAVSTAGVRPNPRWLPGLLAQGYSIYCGFDADTPGEDMAQQMMALYPRVQRLRPTQHDWNDLLQSHPPSPLPTPI
ncbi:MAG: hypothetical protein DMG57_43345 [Acidobacteria bacterium]|nr:MAG: hypothetical protein DMG57_43345 [Acidobacteriota bacterium]